MRTLLLTPVLLATLAACGGGDGGERLQASATASTDLVVSMTPSKGAPPETWTLLCDPQGGDHPDVQGACGLLDERPQVLDPRPGDETCTQVFGGEQTATIRGRVGDKQVDLALHRADGCGTAQWDALVPLLPRPS